VKSLRNSGLNVPTPSFSPVIMCIQFVDMVPSFLSTATEVLSTASLRPNTGSSRSTVFLSPRKTVTLGFLFVYLVKDSEGTLVRLQESCKAQAAETSTNNDNRGFS
jgi:hypothetical protein